MLPGNMRLRMPEKSKKPSATMKRGKKAWWRDPGCCYRGLLMPDDNRPFDLFRFVVQFIFGALIGALSGLFLALYLSATDAWLIVVGMALAVGLLAGFLGDRFWASFHDKSWWNPLNWF